jgi:hypothetical protein
VHEKRLVLTGGSSLASSKCSSPLELGAWKLGHHWRDTLAAMNSHIEVLSSFVTQLCCDTHSSFFSSNMILLKCSAHLTCLCSTYTVGLSVATVMTDVF